MSNPIDQAVSEILTTRDFCGDEREALRAVESDNGVKFTADERREIWGRVNGTWKESQVAAGAKILSSHERQSACRALEDDDWTPETNRRLRMNHARNCSNFET